MQQIERVCTRCKSALELSRQGNYFCARCHSESRQQMAQFSCGSELPIRYETEQESRGRDR